MSKNLGLSGNLINKHDNIILGREQTTTNKFHDLNKKYSFSILNVCGMIIHAIPVIHIIIKFLSLWSLIDNLQVIIIK